MDKRWYEVLAEYDDHLQFGLKMTTTLSWKLSTEPEQTPEYWLLFVDGFACEALTSLAPYKGVDSYSLDLITVDSQHMPTDGASHVYSVALVGQGAIGPLSKAVSIALPPLAVAAVRNVQQPAAPAIVWPSADSVTLT